MTKLLGHLYCSGKKLLCLLILTSRLHDLGKNDIARSQVYFSQRLLTQGNRLS